MLYFVTTSTEGGGSDFWLVLADSAEQAREMFDDEYTKVIDITTDVTGSLIDQYGGMALLCTP